MGEKVRLIIVGVGLAITWSRRHNEYATDRCTLRVVVWSTYSNVSWGLLVVYRTYGNVSRGLLLGAWLRQRPDSQPKITFHEFYYTYVIRPSRFVHLIARTYYMYQLLDMTYQ